MWRKELCRKFAPFFFVLFPKSLITPATNLTICKEYYMSLPFSIVCVNILWFILVLMSPSNITYLFKLDTWLLKNYCVCYFFNKTEMSKEQQINESFTKTVCPVINITDCLDTVICFGHNWLFIYTTRKNYQSLVRMVACFYHEKF